MILRVNSANDNNFVISGSMPEDEKKYADTRGEAAAIAYTLLRGVPLGVIIELAPMLQQAIETHKQSRDATKALLEEYKEHAAKREIK